MKVQLALAVIVASIATIQAQLGSFPAVGWGTNLGSQLIKLIANSERHRAVLSSRTGLEGGYVFGALRKMIVLDTMAKFTLTLMNMVI